MTIEQLIVFTRYPQPGKAKTRLIPALGAEGAATLQRQMTEYTLKQVRRWENANGGVSEIWFAGSAEPDHDRQQMQTWLGNDRTYQVQASGDLGTRMSQAFAAAFAAGMKRVVTIGTDCPQLDADRISEAFAALHNHDLVLGTATDGGYYLIGLRQPIPELFEGIEWSTSAVLQQTIEIANSLGLKTACLAPLSDIDRPEDLPVWEAVVAAKPKISVIIPVLNEANSIQRLLQQIRHQQEDAIELIVVDGGSQDNTVALARAEGAIVISTAQGRATQMNGGATVALGEILLFLHADTTLPPNFATLVQTTLAQPGVVAGAFELRIDGKEWGLRLIEWGVKWRSTLLQLPYGDQAIFLKAKTFEQIGGFSLLPIMEDFELIGRLRRLGEIATVPVAVITSARRWQKLGIFKTTLINQLVILAYFLGVAPTNLADLYRRGK